jgi:AraC-like DNA-binding protein/mannose-6-phosphate isomerase-like protein (cupin superfamily)
MPQRTLQQDANVQWQEFEPNDLLSQIRVHVYCVYRSVLGTTWRTESAQDSKDRIYYIVSGSGQIEHHGETFPLRPGGLYLIPANTRHSHRCDGRMELCWCHFCAENAYGTPLFAHLAVPYACCPDDGMGIPEIFERMVRLYRDDSPGAVYRRSGLLMQTLAPFIEQADMEQWRLWDLSAERFRPVLAMIDQRLADPLSTEMLADAAHLSRSYFISRFKQTFGISPHQYQLMRRIEQARLRLLKTSDTLDRISADLGFADAFHFSRLFKKMTGRSPQAFRSDHATKSKRWQRAKL